MSKRIKYLSKQSYGETKFWVCFSIQFRWILPSALEACVADSGLKLVTCREGNEEQNGTTRPSHRMKHGTWSSRPTLAPWTSKASTHGALAQCPFDMWMQRNGLMQRAHVKEQKKKAWREFCVQRQIQSTQKLLSQPLSSLISLISWPPLHLVKPGHGGHRVQRMEQNGIVATVSAKSLQQIGEMMLSVSKKSRTQPNKQQSHIFWKGISIASVLPFKCCDTNIVLNICPFRRAPAPLRPCSAPARAHLSPQAAAR